MRVGAAGGSQHAFGTGAHAAISSLLPLTRRMARAQSKGTRLDALWQVSRETQPSALQQAMARSEQAGWESQAAVAAVVARAAAQVAARVERHAQLPGRRHVGA